MTSDVQTATHRSMTSTRRTCRHNCGAGNVVNGNRAYSTVTKTDLVISHQSELLLARCAFLGTYAENCFVTHSISASYGAQQLISIKGWNWLEAE
jgi:hypothetical protein